MMLPKYAYTHTYIHTYIHIYSEHEMTVYCCTDSLTLSTTLKKILTEYPDVNLPFSIYPIKL